MKTFYFHGATYVIVSFLAHNSEDGSKHGLIFQENSRQIPIYNGFSLSPNISAESLRSKNPQNNQDIIASLMNKSKTMDKKFHNEEPNFQEEFVQRPVLSPSKYQSGNPWSNFIDFITSFIKKSKTINENFTYKRGK